MRTSWDVDKTTGREGKGMEKNVLIWLCGEDIILLGGLLLR